MLRQILARSARLRFGVNVMADDTPPVGILKFISVDQPAAPRELPPLKSELRPREELAPIARRLPVFSFQANPASNKIPPPPHVLRHS
jgi:hypothetical protein